MELNKPLMVVIKPQSQTVLLKQVAFPELLPKPVDFMSLSRKLWGFGVGFCACCSFGFFLSSEIFSKT